jgi:hypothetical protein
MEKNKKSQDNQALNVSDVGNDLYDVTLAMVDGWALDIYNDKGYTLNDIEKMRVKLQYDEAVWTPEGILYMDKTDKTYKGRFSFLSKKIVTIVELKREVNKNLF